MIYHKHYYVKVKCRSDLKNDFNNKYSVTGDVKS